MKLSGFESKLTAMYYTEDKFISLREFLSVKKLRGPD